MKNFYKMVFLIIATLCVVGFSSCIKSETTISSPINSSVSANDVKPTAHPSSLKLVTDRYGSFRKSSSNQQGFYDQFNATDNSINILYTDYATKQRVYLCSRPECKHNDDNCTSWFEIYGSTKLISLDNGNLFLLSSGYGDPQGTSSATVGKIYSFEPNGSNRNVIYELKSNETFVDAVVASDDFLYITVQVGTTKELRRINVTDGSSLTMHQFENTFDRVFGAFENKIVIQKITDTERVYECLNIDTNEKVQAYSHSLDNIRLEIVYGSSLYSIRLDNNLLDMPLPFYTVDLISGEEKQVSEILIYNTDATDFIDVYDNKLLISAVDNRDPNNIIPILYYLDLNNKIVDTVSLSYKFYNDIRNVNILAENTDHFLIETGVNVNGHKTLFDNAGLPYTVTTAIPTHALIAKQDFWNNTPNYISITDNVK